MKSDQSSRTALTRSGSYLHIVTMTKILVFAGVFFACTNVILGDGKVMPHRDYKGSLEERSQEAIIIFESAQSEGEAVEDLILKISVAGDAEKFAWIIPFPNEPETEKADPELFKELFEYVQFRKSARRLKGRQSDTKSADASVAANEQVEVVSRKIVGDFEIAVVRVNVKGALNNWLDQNGYQSLEDAEDTLEFYRQKEYVFACIKVSSEALQTEKEIDSHPLRFRFKTGGRDGLYFPMKLTGLQNDPFDVNLYVFYPAWLNNDLNEFGFEHRGFRLVHRDWDTAECEKNAGKNWSEPLSDPYLKSAAAKIETITEFFKVHYPGKRFYLTNLQAMQIQPDTVRQWDDDLWMFPHYSDQNFVPYDARQSGAAFDGYRNVSVENGRILSGRLSSGFILSLGIGIAIIAIFSGIVIVKRFTLSGRTPVK